MAWLLDTNVLSELRRPYPEPKVRAFIDSQPVSQLFIGVVTTAEIRFGIDVLADPIRRVALHEWLENTVRPMFDQRVLPVNEEVLFQWRLVVEQGRKVGHTFSLPDSIIAATAIHFGHSVVSRDRSAFDKTGVSVMNPWET
jgi:predicted nucleic acid-binding protein